MTNDSRNIALSVLNELEKRQNRLDNILESLLDDKEVLPQKRDRALLYALVYGVLRWRGRLDAIIRQFSTTPLNKINPNILNILRLGIFQILYLDKIPVSAAVNTSVEMAKSSAAPWVTKFVNGVLRNIARANEKPLLTPHHSLAVNKSFPEWLIKRWLKRFEAEETEKLCDAINTIPPITIRTNTLKTTREKLVNALRNDVEKIETSEHYTSDAISFSSPRISIPEMETFKNGWFQVQDEAAQLVTYLLNPKPGDMILDACAGLGGKTGHIAQMMNNTGMIFSVDKEADKLQRLMSEMNRLGISIVKTHIHDLSTPLHISLFSLPNSHLFDRILIDSPCSGLGVLRRNPDAKWSVFKQDLTHCQKRQIKFLDNISHLVKPCGVMVYAVCSTEPEEGEAVAEAFLSRHSDFVLEKDFQELPDNMRSLINQDGYFRTFPHLNDMDGFFAVCLKRVPN